MTLCRSRVGRAQRAARGARRAGGRAEALGPFDLLELGEGLLAKARIRIAQVADQRIAGEPFGAPALLLGHGLWRRG